MVTDKFPRNLSNLRHERKLSQKLASAALNVSQALLSHYEKGIREPGLDFLLRAAEYYECSVDYLLGRTNDRRGMAYIPEEYELVHSDESPASEVKQITGAITSLSNLLIQTDNDPVLSQCLGYLKTCLYRLVRQICADDETHRQYFRLPHTAACALSGAMLSVTEEKLSLLCPENTSKLPPETTTLENIEGWQSLTDIVREIEERAELLSRFEF